MKKINKSKDAFVLLIALAFISLLALGSTFLLKVSSQKAYTELNRTYTEMARIIAESGVHISVAAIQRDPSNLADGFDPIEIGDGTATIVIEESDISGEVSLSSTSSEEKYYDLTSTGTYGKQRATVAVLLRVTSNSSDEEDPELRSLFNGAIFCGGNLSVKNGVEIDLRGGSMHVNGTIDMKNKSKLTNSSTTNVVITCPTPKTGPGSIASNIGVDFSADKKYVDLDLDVFKKYAESHGGMITGSTTVNNSTPFPGGLLYVTGSVSISGAVEGCIIATGNITLGNSASIKSTAGFPALVSIDGNMEFKNGSSVQGFVYAKKGSLDMKNGGQVTGAIFCAGDLEFKAKEDFVYKNSFPLGPNGQSVIEWAGSPTESSFGGIKVVRWFK